MATILPGSPPSFNKADVAGTVKQLCNYTRTLQENLDFQLGQFKKDMTEARRDIEGLHSSVESLQRAVESMQGSLSTLANQYNALALRVAALEQASAANN